MNLTELTTEIINGRRLTRDDDLSFFETADLTELAAGANEIRQPVLSDLQFQKMTDRHFLKLQI